MLELVFEGYCKVSGEVEERTKVPSRAMGSYDLRVGAGEGDSVASR